MAEIPYCAAPDPQLRTPRLTLPASWIGMVPRDLPMPKCL